MHDYTGFIAAAYGISALALAGLGLWLFLDARARRAELKLLEARGVRRRSMARAEAGAS
ncbi:heme exporter protein CcmD [Mangrovibrevibacter kandeliae]|uniref:heme exporter protein CcmD n=1 Tax=Mangrovibrevibacter kandeliae TaxID=2968473 RepID=UPI0021187802|nr:heme exporter protein CcmD [Aurantimonas sp. CSK15Z-1]MCQ8782987.1 heme exporter protein CcmD [Aurantimonas sp. CSK15Z-1]